MAVPNPAPAVGVDRGVEVAFMTSAGNPHDRVMWKQTEKTRLLTVERRKARQQKESNRWWRTCRSIAKLPRRAANRRWDFAHQTSTHLAKSHSLVAVEALVIPNMTRSASGSVEEPGRQVRQKAGLNRRILDKGWGLVIEQLRYKCPQQGSVLVEVPARNTSLSCPACEHVSVLNRPLRAVFVCVGCGHSDHADIIAAINIRERGIELAPTGGQPGTPSEQAIADLASTSSGGRRMVTSQRNPRPSGRGGCQPQMGLTVLAAVLVAIWLFWPEQVQQILGFVGSAGAALRASGSG